MKTRGMSMVEVVVAVMVLASVLLAYYTLTQSTVRSTSQTRNQVFATQAAENAIEEILAHPYGSVFEVENLTYEPVMFVRGRPVQTRFKVSVEPNKTMGGNGSFRGDTLDDFDVLDIKVSWMETMPSGQGSREQNIEFSLNLQRQYDL